MLINLSIFLSLFVTHSYGALFESISETGISCYEQTEGPFFEDEQVPDWAKDRQCNTTALDLAYDQQNDQAFAFAASYKGLPGKNCPSDASVLHVGVFALAEEGNIKMDLMFQTWTEDYVPDTTRLSLSLSLSLSLGGTENEEVKYPFVENNLCVPPPLCVRKKQKTIHKIGPSRRLELYSFRQPTFSTFT